MKGYLYDANTKEFLNEIELQLDVLETQIKGKDVFMKPNNCTLIKPIEKQINKIVVFDDNNWILKEDNRGKIIYNKTTKEPKIINNLEPITNEFTFEKPFNFSIFDEKTQKFILDKNKINEFKNNKINQLKQLGESKVYETMPLFKQVNASLGIYDTIKTKEIKDAITNVKTKVDTAEAEILALTSIEAVEAYDINIF